MKCHYCNGKGYIFKLSSESMRTAREKKGYSLRLIARYLQVSAAYLSDVELGKRNGNKKIHQFYEQLIKKEEH